MKNRKIITAAVGLVVSILFSCNASDPVAQKPDVESTTQTRVPTKNDSILFGAAKSGDLALVKKMLSEKADPNARGDGDADHDENGRAIDISARNWTALMIATDKNHQEIVQLLLDNNADIEAKNDVRNSALFYACQGDKSGIANLLLDHNANPNVYSTDGTTALYWAINYELQPLAIRLIKAGSDVNAASAESGRTVLMNAYYNKMPAVGELLIEKGANVNAVSKKYGSTALMMAAGQNYLKSVNMLLDRGADVNVIEENMYTALSHAASNDSDDVRIPALLISKGAKINHDIDLGFTPLMEAARSGNLKIAKLLLAKGANVNTSAIRRGGIVALREAVFACDLEMTKLLVEHGADVNALTESRSSILLEAVWNEHNLKIVEYLIEKGAKVNLAKNDGETPLLKSVSYNDPAMAKLLLENGADINVKDVYGNTVYSAAKDRGNKVLIDLVNNHNKD